MQPRKVIVYNITMALENADKLDPPQKYGKAYVLIHNTQCNIQQTTQPCSHVLYAQHLRRIYEQ